MSVRQPWRHGDLGSPIFKQVAFKETYHGYGIQNFLEFDSSSATGDRIGPHVLPYMKHCYADCYASTHMACSARSCFLEAGWAPDPFSGPRTLLEGAWATEDPGGLRASLSRLGSGDRPG